MNTENRVTSLSDDEDDAEECRPDPDGTVDIVIDCPDNEEPFTLDGDECEGGEDYAPEVECDEEFAKRLQKQFDYDDLMSEQHEVERRAAEAKVAAELETKEVFEVEGEGCLEMQPAPELCDDEEILVSSLPPPLPVPPPPDPEVCNHSGRFSPQDETMENENAKNDESGRYEDETFATDSAKSAATGLKEGKDDTAEDADTLSTCSDTNEGTGPDVRCFHGYTRDRHFRITICVLSVFVGLMLFAAGLGWGLVFVFLALPFYVNYAFFKSNTFRYLRNIKSTDDFLEYIQELYTTNPRLYWHIQCYHYETRKYTTYDGSSYNSTTNTTTHHYTKHKEEVRKNTHCNSSYVTYNKCCDVSAKLGPEDFPDDNHPVKVRISKKWSDGDDYVGVDKNAFISRNDRDTHYDFWSTFEIPGERRQGHHEDHLVFRDPDERPFLIHWGWYVIFHLTVFLSLPYLMYISSLTEKIETLVLKELWMLESPSSTDQNSDEKTGVEEETSDTT